MSNEGADRDDTMCPVCGTGRLTDISFDEGGEQRPESREVLTFTCGHEVKGQPLEVADTDKLDVEERQTEMTVDPGPAGPGQGSTQDER